MSDGQFIERGTLDLWSYIMQEQRDTIARLRADLAAVPAQGDYFEGLEEGIRIGRSEPQPDPRDEVIGALVEAATHLCDGIATMLPPLGQSDRVLNLRAALAAAKAVLK